MHACLSDEACSQDFIMICLPFNDNSSIINNNSTCNYLSAFLDNKTRCLCLY